MFESFHVADLGSGKDLPEGLGTFERILLLDVVEHLPNPEQFMDRLHAYLEKMPRTELIVTTGNVAFILVRLALLVGSFNYGPRGILDLTHKRLFTFGSLARLFEERGFEITDISGIPAPFPLALGQTRLAHSLLVLNRALISLSRGLFSYQIVITARPRPSLALLLSRAERSGREKAANLEK